LRWAAILLNSLKRYDDANAVNEYLFERDPVGNIAKINLASTYLSSGRYEDAARICEIQVAIDTGLGPCRSRLVDAYLHTGEFEKALQSLDLMQGSRMHTRFAAMVYFALGRQADFENAVTVMRIAYESGDSGMSYWLARAYTFADDADNAMYWYEQAADDGVLDIAPELSDYDNIRDDPRWSALIERTGQSSDQLRNIELSVAIPAS
jgi:tetratricopeptide (TPR) repeat protein